MHSQSSFAGPLGLLVIVLAVDVWVYLDAHARAGRRRPVVATIGSFTLQTPGTWMLACLVLWILFFPMYLVARTRS